MINFDVITSNSREQVRNGICDAEGCITLSINANDGAISRRHQIAWMDRDIQNEEFVIEFEFKFVDWVKTNDTGLVFQLYSAPDQNPWSPPFAIIVEKGAFQLRYRDGKTFESSRWHTILNDAEFDYAGWHSIKIHAKQNNYLTIELDKKPVRTGRLNWGYGARLIPTFGPYWWNCPENWDDASEQKSIVFRNIAVKVMK